jgi:hypothetical protein
MIQAIVIRSLHYVIPLGRVKPVLLSGGGP